MQEIFEALKNAKVWSPGSKVPEDGSQNRKRWNDLRQH